MSTPVPPNRFRVPSRPPTQVELDNTRAWPERQSKDLEDVRASAVKWRDGVAGLVTIVTGALVVGGPESVGNLDAPWRYIVTALLFAGYGLIVLGLWVALGASAGRPSAGSLVDLNDRQISLRQLDITSAVAAATRLKRARGLVVTALSLLWVGTATWWLSPTTPDDPTYNNQVKLTLVDGNEVCGTLEAVDDKKLELDAASGSTPTVVRLAAILAIRAGECS